MSSTTALFLCIAMFFNGFTIGFVLCAILAVNGRDDETEH